MYHSSHSSIKIFDCLHKKYATVAMKICNKYLQKNKRLTYVC